MKATSHQVDDVGEFANLRMVKKSILVNAGDFEDSPAE
jgi:hypothetical protein